MTHTQKTTAKQHTSPMTQASKTTHIINDSGLQNNTHHQWLRPPKQHTTNNTHHQWLRPSKRHTSSITQASKTKHHQWLRPPKQHTSQTDTHKNPKLAASIQNKGHNTQRAWSLLEEQKRTPVSCVLSTSSSYWSCESLLRLITGVSVCHKPVKCQLCASWPLCELEVATPTTKQTNVTKLSPQL